MKHSGLTLASCAAALSLSLSLHAFAQVVRYEVIDLGVLPSASPAESRAYAINSLHEIAGQAAASNGQFHAAVWLFCPNYGLSAQEWHDLSPAGETGHFGWALDINDAGLVVGGQTVHAHTTDSTRPYVWDLATPANNLELSTFYDAPGSLLYGVGDAWAVNNGSPALIVGGAQSAMFCGSHAFLYVQGDAATALTDLGTASGDAYSAATGLNDLAAPLAAGVSDACSKFGDCNQNRDAVNWTLSSTPTMDLLPDSGGAYGAQGAGINDAGNTVGSFLTTDTPCVFHAAFWPDSSSSPVDLGSVGISAAHESHAYKLTQEGPSSVLTIIGENHYLQTAYRWHRNGGGTWSGVDLNTKISPLCGWKLAIAYDISDDGWIVGVGGVNNQAHGFLLRPVECVGDFNHDCTVDGADLGFLLGAWSSCENEDVCAQCRADLTLDGIVDGADLGILLGNWEHECECWGCPEEEEFRMSSENQGAQEVQLATALALVGFTSVAELNAWLAEVSPAQASATLNSLLSYLLAQQ